MSHPDKPLLPIDQWPQAALNEIRDLGSQPRQIVCPFCGMSTWHVDHCDNPFCDGPDQRAEDQRDCPDCEQGKHANCDGNSWSNLDNTFTPCPCEMRGHR